MIIRILKYETMGEQDAGGDGFGADFGRLGGGHDNKQESRNKKLGKGDGDVCYTCTTHLPTCLPAYLPT